MMSEGIDIPTIDGVFFVDNKNSDIDIVQCIGRSIRLRKNNISKIFVPIINTPSSIETSIKNSNLITILKSLYEVDENVEEPIKNNIISINCDINNYEFDFETFLKKNISGFQYNYNIIKKINHIPSIYSEDIDEYNLAQWSEKIRNKYKNNKIDKEKIKLLDDLKFWYWNNDDINNKMIDDVNNWIKLNDCLPITELKITNKNIILKYCKHLIQERKKNKLSYEQIKKLENIKWWYWDYNTPFISGLIKLYDFIKTYRSLPNFKSENEYEKYLVYWYNSNKEFNDSNTLLQKETELFSKIKKWL